MIVFGDNVRRLRRDRGLTQEALAERSNLHLNFVGRLERGQILSPELISMLKLAAGLGVEPSALLEPFTPVVMKRLRARLMRESANPHEFVAIKPSTE